MKKPQFGSKAPSGTAENLSCELLMLEVPTVGEFLTTNQYDDGSKRDRSTLSVWVEDGMVKVALNDKNVSASLYRSGECLLDALRSLEKALQDDGNADWRVWKNKRGK